MKPKNWIQAFFIFLVLVTAMPARAAEPFRLGVAVVKSGELASYGISGLRGVELAVRELNGRGGILGRHIEIVVEDDACLPKNALTIASKLMAKDVHAVIGHICSGATFAALDTYKTENIITISPSATHPALTQSGNYPNFFRTIASDDTQALVQVELAVNRLKLKRIAVLHDKSVYGKGLAEFVRGILMQTDPRKIVLFEGVATGAINYTQMVQKLKKADVDGVIYGGYHPGAAKIVKQLRSQQMDTVFISGDGIKDEAFLTASGPAGQGVYATAPKDTSAIPMAIDAVTAHLKTFGEDPGPFFLTAWAAVLALANAVDTAGSLDYEAVAAALKSETVQTPIGAIGFDERGDATGTGFSVFQVRDSRFVEHP